MTQNELVSIIFSICTIISSNKEEKISCFDELTNCSVVESGKILELQEFKKKCLKK